MAEDKKDLLEKGAIIQRDKKTYAVAPHLPAGLVTPAQLRTIADVAEKYKAAALKLSSAARIAIVGLKEEDLDNVWKEVGLKPGHAIGYCVRSVKVCPGATLCKKGKCDSLTLGLELDKLYHGFQTPGKTKMGVSGCMNGCAEPYIKDIGVLGVLPNKWRLLVGGCATGSRPRIADVFADGLTAEQVKEYIAKILKYYTETVKTKKRLGLVINELGGIDNFRKAVLEYSSKD